MVDTPAAGAATPLAGCEASSLYVVAHQDDSLLFQSPDLLQDVASGHCVRSIFLTAGDAGQGASYWSTREEGVEAAYAQMAGVPDSWTKSSELVNGHPIAEATLNGAPRVSVLFLRLPDGFPDGQGSDLFGHESLRRLWAHGNPNGSLEPTISSIDAIDGSTSYGYQDLIETLTAAMRSFQPQVIATQNFEGSLSGADHADHVATGLFTAAAQGAYGAAHRLIGYEDYESSQRPANVSGALLAAKQGYFYTYGEHDSHACAGAGACEPTEYWSWLARQYVAAVRITGAVANAGPDQSVASGAAVALDGSASSAEGGKALTYQWTQIAGPA
ncbi:MAG: PIG-L family deacetylase, partial [Solirubrobacterales bacterium]